jgi:hypothetical protein
MAKRYHQSKRDRMDERYGMEHREERRMAARMTGERLEHHPDRFNDENRRDRDGERSGPYKYDRSLKRADDLYAGADSRKYREMADAGMIHEDRNAVANLPQNVVYRPYGDPTRYLPEEINDTIIGIDRQKGYDMKKSLEHFYPKKV